MLRVARVDAFKNRTAARHPRIRTLFESRYICALHVIVERSREILQQMITEAMIEELKGNKKQKLLLNEEREEINCCYIFKYCHSIILISMFFKYFP
jgi:hypothetical protein